MKNFINSFLPALLVLLQVHFAFAQSAVLLPPGEQQYFDNNGNPLAGGSVYYYSPNTTTFQTTWQNPTQTIVNTNPVILDGAGRAIIYGVGTYRQVVYDALQNLIWDQLTSSGTSSGGSATNFGDGNAVGTIKAWAGIVAPAQYQFANGQQILRASFPDLFTAITQVQSVVCTAGSNILTAVTDTTQIPTGANVEVSCVPGTSTVTATTGSTVTLSSVATISSAVNATFFPFGNGNGSTTFSVPDLRGYVIAGRDNMGGTAAGRLTSTYFTNNPDSLGASGGTQSTALTLAQMAGHTHTATVTDPGHAHSMGTTSGAANGASFVSISTPGIGANTQTAVTGITVQNSSSGGGISQTASLNTAGGVPESTAIASAGSGYTNGSRVLTVTGGTCSIQPAFNVTVSGNVVTQVNSVSVAGNCTVYPANPAATTGGGGTGATLNVAYVGSGGVVAAIVNTGSGYTNGTQTLTVLGGTCPIQPTVTALVSSGNVQAISTVVNPGTPYYCTVAPPNPATLSDGSNVNATANIPFNPGGAAYTSGSRIFTVQGGTCTTQPQFNALVTNGQITTVGAQATASNCSAAPTNPALIQDAGGVAASATVNAGGSGYTNGAITLTVLGGTCSVQPQFNATVISGTVTAINSLATPGACTIAPSNPVATNGGGGVGATLNVTYTITGSGATFNVIYGPQPFSNIQPTLTLNYVIKVLPDTSLSTTNVVTSINGLSGAWTCGANMTCAGNVLSSSGGGGGSGNLTVGTTTITSGTSGRILYDNAGILGETLTTGTGNTVVFQSSPTLITPQLGIAQATSINGLTITTTTGSLTIPSGTAITWSGSNNFTATTTGVTSVTFPTSGTLVNTAVTTLSSLVGVGTLTSGGTGAGFTLALGTSTLTGQVPVANGGTGLASGTSGGVLAFTASGTIASSGALTANLPVIGGGAGAAPTVGTRSGNTTAFVTTSGALTNGHCAQWDGSGNAVDSGGACGGGGGSGTVNAGTANQLAYYVGAGTAISGLTTGNNGTLITSAGGVPSISSTLPAAVQGNITTVGTVTSGVWNGTVVDLAHGGTNANLTASNGGIFYSTGSAGAILAGTVTANQCLLSGSSAAPSWGSCTSSLTVGTTTIASGTTTRVLFDNAGVLGEYTISGTGNVVMSTSPTITTPTFSGTVTGPAGTWTAANGVNVAGGGTGITSGTSGGIPYFNSTSTMASSGTLTANLPVIGGGAGGAPTVGSRSGNTTSFATTTGSLTSGNCVKWDASGNAVDNGSVCGSLTVGTTTIASGTTQQLLYDNAGVVGEITKGNNCVYGTNGTGVPSCTTTLPSAVVASSLTSVGTLTSLTVSGGTSNFGFANTGNFNTISINNAGTSTTANTKAILQAALTDGLCGVVCTAQLSVNGNATPFAAFATDSGLTGGFFISTTAGPIQINGKTNLQFQVNSGAAFDCAFTTASACTFTYAVKFPVTTIAGLPACVAGLQGARYVVNNGQTTPTFLGTVSTTGAVVAPVFCNGSAWVYG